MTRSNCAWAALAALLLFPLCAPAQNVPLAAHPYPPTASVSPPHASYAAPAVATIPQSETSPVVPAGHSACACNGAGCGACGGRRTIPPCCEPRKTLLQWSYGTSFEGGPPSMDEPLVSDRPDFTESSTTVGRGVVQLEAGYTYTFDEQHGDQAKHHSFPETLLRIGLFAEWFEFRIAYNHASVGTITSGIFGSDTGGEDLYVGAKIGLTPQEGILPEMAIMPQMTLPTGHNDFTSHQVQPGLNWLYGWDINDFLSCGGSTQANKSTDEDGGTYVEFAQSFTIGYALTERLGAYTEYFGFYPSGASSARPENYFDGGFTFSVTNNLQLDIRGGVGLDEAAADYFVGSGFVIRF